MCFPDFQLIFEKKPDFSEKALHGTSRTRLQKNGAKSKKLAVFKLTNPVSGCIVRYLV